MSDKWTHATVECFQCNSYSVSNFYVRRGQVITVTDKDLVKKLKRVKQLSVVDFFEEEAEEEAEEEETLEVKAKAKKKGK